MSEANDIIAFYTSVPADSIIDTTLSTSREVGFEVDEDSRRTEELLGQTYEKFDLYYGDRYGTLAFNVNGDRPPDEPVLSFRCRKSISPAHAVDERTFRDRMHAVFELLCRLSVTLDVDYTPVFSPADRRAALDDRPIAESVEELPRIGVYDRAVIDQFGGLESMFDATPWYTATLEREKTVVVETRDPWDSVDWQPPIDADFVTDATFAGPDERGERGAPDFEDPFAALETGAIGTDLCVPRERIGPEFRNEDLEPVRVRVDERRDLRRLDTGAFVRNVVDDEPGDPAEFMMAMLEEIPADATDDDLMVSALLHEAVPPAFVRLDERNDETVVTRVADLDVDVAKADLLIRLGRIAREGEFTDEDLREMERFLETLDRLDDIEGIEQRIRNHLL